MAWLDFGVEPAFANFQACYYFTPFLEIFGNFEMGSICSCATWQPLFRPQIALE